MFNIIHPCKPYLGLFKHDQVLSTYLATLSTCWTWTCLCAYFKKNWLCEFWRAKEKRVVRTIYRRERGWEREREGGRELGIKGNARGVRDGGQQEVASSSSSTAVRSNDACKARGTSLRSFNKKREKERRYASRHSRIPTYRECNSM